MQERDLQCLILAGGRGSRLGASAAGRPKHLVDIQGRPFADLQLSFLAGAGVRRVVYCIGHLGDQIRDYVGDGGRFNLHADFVDEGEDLLGTAGAIRLAHDSVHLDDRFLVIYGDSLPDLDLRAVVRTAESTGLPALMTVFHNHGELDQSNADFDGLLVTYNKQEPDPNMEWIDYGVSVLTKELVRTIPPGEFIDLADVLGEVSLRRQLAGYPADRRFHEVGTPHSRDELVRSLDQQRKAT